jgi:hypothetical protein
MRRLIMGWSHVERLSKIGAGASLSQKMSDECGED